MMVLQETCRGILMSLCLHIVVCRWLICTRSCNAGCTGCSVIKVKHFKSLVFATDRLRLSLCVCQYSTKGSRQRMTFFCLREQFLCLTSNSWLGRAAVSHLLTNISGSEADEGRRMERWGLQAHLSSDVFPYCTPFPFPLELLLNQISAFVST